MIEFCQSTEQQKFRSKVRDFAQTVIRPLRKELDSNTKTPWAVLKEAAKQNLLLDKYSYVDLGILIEEVASEDFNCALPILWSTLKYPLFKLPGVPDEAKSELLKKVQQGKQFIALAFTEPEAGSDMGAFKTTAELRGDHYYINGVKNSVSYSDANAFIVSCRTGDISKGVKTLTNFFVPADKDGLEVTKIWQDIGSHAAARGVLKFTNVKIPKNFVIGEANNGYPPVADFFDTNRAYIGLKCIGEAQASIRETCEYVKNRSSMGRTLSSYQGISFPLAEGETYLEAARLLCYKTLWLADQGKRRSKEGAMCKWWVPEISFEIVRKCLTFHGQYGYTTELPFEQRLRDILGWQIGDGSAEISKLLVARDILGRGLVG